jgi:hypothetical protein
MAIKGKSKGRGARTVARGPKPVYTPVKRPFWQKKTFWYAIAAVLAIAAVVGLIYGFMKERNDQREQDEIAREATAARSYGGKLDTILASVGQQNATGFVAFPQIGSALDALEQDAASQDPEQLSSSLDDLAGTAKTASESLAALDAAKIVRNKDLDPTFIVYLLGSKDDITSGLRLYEQAAHLAALAATTTGPDQTALITRAKAVNTLAGEVFAHGYDDYVQAQSIAQTFQPQVPSGVSGIVPGASGFPLSGATGALTGAATGTATGTTGAATGSTDTATGATAG